MPLPANPNESDLELMHRVQRGDAEAFELLHGRYASMAFGVALSVCRNVQQAEEAVQEGFLSIWRGRLTYQAQPDSSFKAWAMQTVRNRAIDSVRRTDPVASVPLVDAAVLNVADPAVSPADQLIASGESAALRHHLRKLPSPQTEAIALAYFGGLSHLEIADQLDLPAGTVKGRIRLGLEKLRRRIGPPEKGRRRPSGAD